MELHLCVRHNGNLEPGNSGIGFTVKDVAAEEARLRKLAVEFTLPTTPGPIGSYARFTDPDGNEFLISEE